MHLPAYNSRDVCRQVQKWVNLPHHAERCACAGVSHEGEAVQRLRREVQDCLAAAERVLSGQEPVFTAPSSLSANGAGGSTSYPTAQDPMQDGGARCWQPPCSTCAPSAGSRNLPGCTRRVQDKQICMLQARQVWPYLVQH